MSDVKCSRCGVEKPEVAFPTRGGKRNGLICLGCRNAAVRHVARPSKSRHKRGMLLIRTWKCAGCGKGYPAVYPQSGTGTVSLDAVVKCRGCVLRERHAARRAG